MKLILALLIILNINFCLGSKFINFIPYNNQQCNGQPSGIGYSILEYSCFSIDYAYSYQITSKNDDQLIQWVQYPRSQGSTLCYYTGLPVNKVQVNTCFEGTGQSVFDIYRWPTNKTYYTITVTDQPYYPTNQKGISVMQFMGNGECSSDNIEIIQYFTNNTVTEDDNTGIDLKWYCDGETNKPFAAQCYSNNCVDVSKSFNCEHTHPFYNTSTEISGGTGAGDYSGTGASSTTGSGSGGSGSGSGSSSGSGFGFNIEINDKKQIKQQEFTSSSGLINNNIEKGKKDNYITSYCT